MFLNSVEIMKKPIIFLTLLLLSNVPSLYYGFYLEFAWFDIAQHLLGGFLISMLFSEYLKDNFRDNKPIQNILILVGSTIFIGVIWEFAEYMANQILIDPFYRWFHIRAYFMGDLNDTVKDLADDIIGAFTFSIIFLRPRKSN